MSLPKIHKVYRLTDFNSIDDIKQSTEPLPEYGPDDILVKVKAVSLNRRDILIATNNYPLPVERNVVPCSDFSGEVVAVGSKVGEADFKLGDRVIGNFQVYNLVGTPTRWDDTLGSTFDGGLREYVVIPAVGANRVSPDVKLSWKQLASLTCAAVTAWNGLYGNPGSPLLPGHTVLSLGTGGVSLIGLAIAKAAGARTIVTSSSDEKLAKAQKEYGVDLVVNYKTHPNWSAEVLKLTGGRGVDLVLESGGQSTLAESFASLAMGGQISIIGLNASEGPLADASLQCIYKAATVRGILVGSKQLTQQLLQFLAVNPIKIPIDKEYDFEHSLDAYHYLANQGHVGKVVINVE